MEYHEVLYAYQPEESVDGYTDANLLKLTDRVTGLRGPQFDAAVKSMKYRTFVSKSQKAYERAGGAAEPEGPGTPTAVINDRRIPSEANAVLLDTNAATELPRARPRSGSACSVAVELRLHAAAVGHHMKPSGGCSCRAAPNSAGLMCSAERLDCEPVTACLEPGILHDHTDMPELADKHPSNRNDAFTAGCLLLLVLLADVAAGLLVVIVLAVRGLARMEPGSGQAAADPPPADWTPVLCFGVLAWRSA
ncbi:DsbA family protein [Streptomyces sp. CA-179760]|uniref:DsbA family protein n=1 Tax=Streptomyces sp. CA-179760 TaxID=3240054 RepID=UPI003D9369A6